MESTDRPYVSRRDLVAGFRAVGLEAGMHVVVHSSLKRFGIVEDGPHGVIDALEEVITPKGTLVMPTLTLPSPSITATGTSGRAAAMPRPIDEARPIEPIM